MTRKGTARRPLLRFGAAAVGVPIGLATPGGRCEPSPNNRLALSNPAECPIERQGVSQPSVKPLESTLTSTPRSGCIVATLSRAGGREGGKTPGTFRCEHEGISVEHRSPEHKLARKLIDAGYDPDRPFQTVWDNGTPSLRWRTLGAAAGSEAYEDDRRGLQFKRWKPFPARPATPGSTKAAEAVPEPRRAFRPSVTRPAAGKPVFHPKRCAQANPLPVQRELSAVRSPAIS
jgi:hypothetical protein